MWTRVFIFGDRGYSNGRYGRCCYVNHVSSTDIVTYTDIASYSLYQSPPKKRYYYGWSPPLSIGTCKIPHNLTLSLSYNHKCNKGG